MKYINDIFYYYTVFEKYFLIRELLIRSGHNRLIDFLEY